MISLLVITNIMLPGAVSLSTVLLDISPVLQHRILNEHDKTIKDHIGKRKYLSSTDESSSNSILLKFNVDDGHDQSSYTDLLRKDDCFVCRIPP
jgi:hypothetical protein